MVQISTDTSALMTPVQGAEKGVGVAPLNVTIAGQTYRDMDEIMPREFLNIIYAGNLPTSSQPSPGALMEYFEKATEKNPLLHISMADGLSVGLRHPRDHAQQGLHHRCQLGNPLRSSCTDGPHRQEAG